VSTLQFWIYVIFIGGTLAILLWVLIVLLWRFFK